jgi:hypothetical protein
VAQDRWHGSHDFLHDRIRRWWVYQTGDSAMKFILEVFAGLGLAAAVISFIDVTKNPDTKGWGIGLGMFAFVGFKYWASVS